MSQLEQLKHPEMADEPSAADSITAVLPGLEHDLVAHVRSTIERARRLLPVHDCACHGWGKLPKISRLWTWLDLNHRHADYRTAWARIEEDCPPLTESCLKAKQNLFNVLRLMGARGTEWCPGTLNSFLLNFFDLSLVGACVAWWKWHFASVAAAILQEPPIPVPALLDRYLPGSRAGYFLSGGAHVFIRQKMIRRRRSDVWIGQSLQSIKGVFPAPDRFMRIEACEKTLKDLSTPPIDTWEEYPSNEPVNDPRTLPCCVLGSKRSWAEMSELGEQIDAEYLASPIDRRPPCDHCLCKQGDYHLMTRIMFNIRRVARAFAKAACDSVMMDEPSQSAHFNSSIVKGGGMGAFSRWMRPGTWVDREGNVCNHTEEHTDSKALDPCNCQLGIGDKESEHICPYGDGPSEWLYSIFPEKENVAQLIGLPEPGKTRVISKGMPKRQYLLRTLQKMLFGAMRKFPVFRLTNEPVNAEIVSDQLGPPLAGERLDSGDYDGATNNLKGMCSEGFAREFCREVSALHPSPLRDHPDFVDDYESVETLFVESLTQHELVYNWLEQLPTLPTESVVDGLVGDALSARQAKGQLMGSIVSFPVLCAVNFAIWLTGQEFGRSRVGLVRQSVDFHLQRGRVLINGDDILFPSDEHTHDIFWRCATLAGLSKSVGKSFWNSDWCVVNSEFFDVDRRGALVTELHGSQDVAFRTTFYTPSRFVPLGTLFSVSSRGIGTGHTTVLNGGDDHLWSVADGFNYVLKKSPSHLREDLMTLFLSIHHDLLATCPNGVSYYLPVYLGGLGINYPGSVSETQLKSAVLRIWNRAPAVVSQVSTKLTEPLSVKPFWLDRSLESREWYEPSPETTYTPGLTHLQNHFEFERPASEWFKSLSKPQQIYVRKSLPKSMSWTEGLLRAFMAVQRSDKLRIYKEDHAWWMGWAHRSSFKHKWDWTRVWGRIWAVESAGCGSLPAPVVSVHKALRARCPERDSAISTSLD
jgi:hypothetical protein